MEQPAYTKVKVNNEIEFCEVKNVEMKDLVERALLKARVSYFIRWRKPGFFSGDRKEKCVFHVNSQQLEVALNALEEEAEGMEGKIKLLVKENEEKR